MGDLDELLKRLDMVTTAQLLAFPSRVRDKLKSLRLGGDRSPDACTLWDYFLLKAGYREMEMPENPIGSTGYPEYARTPSLPYTWTNQPVVVSVEDGRSASRNWRDTVKAPRFEAA